MTCNIVISMTALLALEIDTEDFALGRITAGEEDIHILLDRVVPLGDGVIPFFWAEGVDFESFERRVRAAPQVENLEALNRVDGSVLYRVKWGGSVCTFTSILITSGATVLEAHGSSSWSFRLRFDNHAALRDFHALCRDADIDFEVINIATEASPMRDDVRYNLTPLQHETLVTAIERGYFDIPRHITLEELSTKFDVSPQALSDRIRRAVQEVLTSSPLPTTAAELDD